MSAPLIVAFDHASPDGVVEGSLAHSDLDGLAVKEGDSIGIMDSGAGPYEAQVLKVDGDRVVVRAPALSTIGMRPGLVNAGALASWANTSEARGDLPRLVRCLLKNTPGVTGLSGRAGAGIDLQGWDLRVDGGSGSPYVPAGPSRWEVSTAKNPQQKAEKDYAKRTKDPLDCDPRHTTFVYVTPRRWPKKEVWAQGKRQLSEWHNVRVLDADDLEGWLETQPGARFWISQKMGLNLSGADTLESWWKLWSESTDPSLSESLLLAGREALADRMLKKLEDGTQVIGVRAGGREEAVAFMAAALSTDGGNLSDIFVIKHLELWEMLASGEGRNVLIPLFDGGNYQAAVAAGHCVLVPMSTEDAGRPFIELPRIGRAEGREAFKSIGIEPDRADRYAVCARRSLVSLRRSLAVYPKVARPPWAQGMEGKTLAILVLVGSWSGHLPGDRDIVARVAGQSYGVVERLLQRWEHMDDPPFRRSGTLWRVANPEDAWELLKHMVIGEDLERWYGAVLDVLGTLDPIMEMREADQWAAPLLGKDPNASPVLRRGLASGVGILSVMGLHGMGQSDGVGRAKSLVSELLKRAGKDEGGKLWRQLSNELPLLAEAAPEVFLEAVEEDLLGDSPLIRSMFTDTFNKHRDPFHSSPHTGLLWALETICWSSDFFPQGIESLLRLTTIDPGGELSNRPLNSAKTVLMPWHPQTGACVDRRLDTFHRLLEHHPDVGQALARRVLSRRNVSFGIRRPRFRVEWLDNSPNTSQEFHHFVKEGARLAMGSIANNPAKLVPWIDKFLGLFPEAQDQVTNSLMQLRPEDIAEEERLHLWQSIDRLLHWCSHNDSLPQGLNEATYQKLERIRTRLCLESFVTALDVRVGEAARLFDWGERPEEERRRAVRELWESGGLEAIVGVAEQAECPAYVGIAAALELSDEALCDLLARAGSDSGQIQELVGGWVRKKSETDGFLWAEKIAGQIRDLPLEVQAQVFLALRPCSEVWKLLDKQGRSVNDLYWKQIGRISAYGVDPRDISEYVGNLMEHDRPWLAINALAVALKKDDNGFVGPDGIEMVLNKAIGSDIEQVLGEMDRYYIGRLLDHLEAVKPDSDTLFESELAFCRLFDWGVARTPLAVHRKLAADPEFFARLVYSAYQNEVEDVWSLSVDVAWSILGGWRTLPGIDAIGEDISSDVLESWIVKARRLLAVYDLTSIGDGYIGELLSGSPIGKDGVWPHESVREVLEELCSQEIEDGMARGLRNSRGVTVRSQYEGGDQERELARKYRQWMRQIDIQWPRTARMLRRLAEAYEAEAEHHDEHAEILADSD
ncbi:MAG: hypothetical protein F4X21_00690 [Acidimicrobiia bacterium]|nr:hypothetical protein [Acidimicrobiia bacterium]